MRLRDFNPGDADRVNRIALAAFAELKPHYSDWPGLTARIGRMAALADTGELIVAERQNAIIGAVAYMPPHAEKADYFDSAWPVMRLLVVDPPHRGRGCGRALSEACIARARRDGAPLIALHTSPIMAVALPMYERMGFSYLRATPPIFGVAYSVYVKYLQDRQGGTQSAAPG